MKTFGSEGGRQAYCRAWGNPVYARRSPRKAEVVTALPGHDRRTLLSVAHRLRRGLSVAGMSMLVAGVASCTQAATPAEPSREGPSASWSLSVASGSRSVAVVGEVAVVADELALLGVSRSDGKELWRRQLPEDYSYTIASELVVIQKTKEGPLEVVDPATGATQWRATRPARFVVTQEAVYSHCDSDRGTHLKGCSITSRDVRNGRVRWSTHGRTFDVSNDLIGARPPYAPGTGPYVAAGIGDPDQPWAALDVQTGQALHGRTQLPGGWYHLAVGRTLIATDHDPPSGDQRCTVSIVAINADTGSTKWSRSLFSGRRKDGECEKALAPLNTGMILIGAGSRIAASTEQGKPQVFDLATGRILWQSSTAGVPIDGDGRTILVRRYADDGELTLLDCASGRARWSAPDPGLSGQSASWESAVTSRLVAISGASGDRPHVVVYRVDNGQRVGRFPGWLVGLGEDWVAIGHSGRSPTVGKLTLDFIRL